MPLAWLTGADNGGQRRRGMRSFERWAIAFSRRRRMIAIISIIAKTSSGADSSTTTQNHSSRVKPGAPIVDCHLDPTRLP